jgi:hypothetical protein
MRRNPTPHNEMNGIAETFRRAIQALPKDQDRERSVQFTFDRYVDIAQRNTTLDLDEIISTLQQELNG